MADTIPQHRKAVYEEAHRLAVLAFDARYLNRDNVVVVPGNPLVGILEGWSDTTERWEVRFPDPDGPPDGGVVKSYASVGCGCDLRYFVDFLIGQRGRIIMQSGDSTPGDAEVRFRRFLAVGGEFGKSAATFAGLPCQE